MLKCNDWPYFLEEKFDEFLIHKPLAYSKQPLSYPPNLLKTRN